MDKRVVKEESSEKDVWWGPVNKPMSPEVRPLFSNLPALARYSLLSHVPPLYCTTGASTGPRPGLPSLWDSHNVTFLIFASYFSHVCMLSLYQTHPSGRVPRIQLFPLLILPSNHVLRFGP